MNINQKRWFRLADFLGLFVASLAITAHVGCGSDADDIAISPMLNLDSGLQPLDLAISIAFHPDGQILYSGIAPYLPNQSENGDPRVIAWDLATGKPVAEIPTEQFPMALATSRDGTTVVVGEGYVTPHPIRHPQRENARSSVRGKVRILRSDTLQEQQSIKTEFGILDMAFSPASNQLALLGARGESKIILAIWQWPKLETVAQFEFEGRPPFSAEMGPTNLVQYSGDGKWLIATIVSSQNDEEVDAEADDSLSGKIVVVNAGENTLHGELIIDEGPICCISLSPDNRQVVGSGYACFHLFNVGLESLTSKIQLDFSPLTEWRGLFSKLQKNTIFIVPQSDSRYQPRFSGGVVMVEKIEKRSEWKFVQSFYSDNSSAIKRYTAFAVSGDERLVAVGTSGVIRIWERGNSETHE